MTTQKACLKPLQIENVPSTWSGHIWSYAYHFDFPDQMLVTIFKDNREVKVNWRNERLNDITLSNKQQCLCYREWVIKSNNVFILGGALLLTTLIYLWKVLSKIAKDCRHDKTQNYNFYK